ncbi:MAG: InlB B-repeat-containing protein, partial [Chitinispirillia bacterium]|nr:InlB B-repeat-containing protein [Chitinispirillia bacterium]MCL2241526.1 InlB B-repeat-containing protein [Chitinispirillia bacterium]
MRRVHHQHRGGITRSADGPSYAAGELVTLVAEPASGYTFAGWAGASTETNPAVTLTMNSNQPLIAMFRPTSATLATTAYPPDGGTINREVNGTQVTVTATPQEGHTFSNWEGASTSTNPSVTVTVDEGKTLVAIFKPNTYTLTVNSSPAAGGWVFVNNTASTGTKAYDVGTVLRVMAQAEDGYNFTGWSGAFTSTKADTTITINNSNQTLTANFVEKDKPVTPPNATYTLTVNAGAGGSVTPSTLQTDINAGTPVPITATANSGYEFNGWTVTSGGATVANTNSATTTVTLSSNATVTANFKHAGGTQPDGTYTLTLNRGPLEGGKVFVNNVESTVPTYHKADTQVVVRAEAAV